TPLPIYAAHVPSHENLPDLFSSPMGEMLQMLPLFFPATFRFEFATLKPPAFIHIHTAPDVDEAMGRASPFTLYPSPPPCALCKPGGVYRGQSSDRRPVFVACALLSLKERHSPPKLRGALCLVGNSDHWEQSIKG
uniref:Uncharacterized protein n=1 Tax=Terrapene triunguis TaxID=2587831 RepID=A0A674K5X4_9SAUR